MALDAPAYRPATLATRLLPERARRWVVSAFFGLLLLAGWRLAPDFGSFTDEPSCRESGQISLTYLYECVPVRWLPARAAARLAAIPPHAHLSLYTDHDYGVAFELPMTLLEKASGYSDLGKVIVLRHRCVWTVCWLGCVAFYWLAARRLGWRAGLLGVVLLLLSPRLFADFFYNAKDAVFLAAFTISMATLVAFVAQPTWQRASWHALACALAIDVRIMGILLPAATAALLLWRAAQGSYAGQQARWAAALYAGLLPVLVMVCWPWLWAAPVAHFWQAFANMSQFTRWAGHTLYQGVLLKENAQLPWHYALVWIGITTPLLYLAGLTVSLALLARQLARHGWQLFATEAEWLDVLAWGWLLAPLVAVIALHSILYDGWRQLYFVYPALLLLALRGLVAVWRWQPSLRWHFYWRGLLAAGVAGAMLQTAYAMSRLHPLENLYFNTLAGSHPELRYEYDYWGLSLRQGLAALVAQAPGQAISVRTNQPNSLVYPAYLLPAAAQHRLRIEQGAGPVNYFITTYRYHPQPYLFGAPVYSLRSQPAGNRILDIFYLGKQLVVPPGYWLEPVGAMPQPSNPLLFAVTSSSSQ